MSSLPPLSLGFDSPIHAWEGSEGPDLVHAWVCQIKGSIQHASVQAMCDREVHQIGEKIEKGGEWISGPAAKTLYQTDLGDENEMMTLCLVPDCLGLVVMG